MTQERQATPYGRIFPPNQSYLARQPAEDIIEPELEIVDTHHHLWDEPANRYLLDELLGDIGSGHNVVATVFIECRAMYRAGGPEELRSVGEVEFAAGVAAMSESGTYGPARVAEGIVGFADLTRGEEVEAVLEALIAAGGGRFRGIRHAAGWHEDGIIGNNHHGAGPGLYLRDDFRAGLARLTALGLSLDALVYFPQHGDLVDLARACPDANLIMNHTGMPLGYGPYAGRGDEVHAAWKASMAELAGCANITLKLGGMMMRLASFDYLNREVPPTSAELAEHWRPYIVTAIELFGATHCTFESNYPVDKMGIGYAALWNAFKRLAADASADEKRALFSGTARRVYQLE